MSREGAYRLASTCAKKRDPVFTPVAMQLPATQHLDLRREENRLRSIIISTVYSLTLFTLPTPSHRYPISSPRPDPTFLKPHEQSPASFRSLFLSGGEMIAPHLRFNHRASCEDQFVHASRVLENNLPRMRSCMALEAFPVVGFLQRSTSESYSSEHGVIL